MDACNKGKKTRLWSVLSCILVAALIVVCGAVILSGCNKTDSGPAELYWNVDQNDYVAKGLNGASGRMPRSDGIYYIRLAANGEQKDYPVADVNVVNRIDMVEIFSPVFDENGVIVDIKTVNECTGGLVANALYITNIEGNKITGNTQGTRRGVDITFEIDENTQIYSVGGTGLMVGLPCGIGLDDEVIAIKDYDGKIIYAFVRTYEAPGDVYWNMVRMYNSTTQSTTRPTDDLGYYVFEMCLNGEVVTVRTRDHKVANTIDANAARCFALTFDEEGNVNGAIGTRNVGCPYTFASWAHVLEINGDSVYAKKYSGSDKGAEHNGVMSKDCKVIDVTTGRYTELRVGDQIHGLRDSGGRICYIFVIDRLSETGEVYWNVSRKYNSTRKTTTRGPANDGYYYIQVATLGKQLTVKTKDRAMATKLDSYAARCFVLELSDDNEILAIKSANAKHGPGIFGSWYYFEKLEGNQLTVSRVLTGDTEPTIQVGTLSPDVEIINGTGMYDSHCGEYTKLKAGDRVHGLTDFNGEIRILYVVERVAHVPIYWNINRNYVTANQHTGRVPDAEGYYHLKMAVDGKQVDLKTKDVEIVNKIDANAARVCGLQVVDGIIYKHYGTGSVNISRGGTKSLSWVDVTNINGLHITAKKNQAGHAQNGKVFNTTMAYGCKVYDVSAGYTDFVGEETTLRVGDRIHVLHNLDGYASVIFVVDGRVKPLSNKPNTCPCNEDVTWLPWDGNAALEDGNYYYLTQDITAPKDGFLIENLNVSIRLDGHTISSPGRCFYIRGGGNLKICDHETRGKLIGSGISGEPGGVIRMYTNSNASVNLWNIDVVHNGTVKPTEGGAISASGPITLHNVNVSGGKSTGKAGNILVNPSGEVRMFGGSVTGGESATNGGNINVNSGKIYLEGTTIADGKGTSKGDNMYIGSTKEMRFKDVTITNAASDGTGVHFASGTLDLEGKIDISNNKGGNVTVNSTAVFRDHGMSSDSKLVVHLSAEQDLLRNAASDLSGCFQSAKPEDYAVVYDKAGKKVVVDCLIVPQTHETDHCVCNGTASGLGGHSCATLTGWQELTADKLEVVVGTSGSNVGYKLKENGNYYLTVDYTLPGVLCVMADQNITICLNGCELTSPQAVALVAGNLNITDCKGGGIASGAAMANGGCVKVVAGGTANLYAGTLTGTQAITSGGVVVVSQDSGYIITDKTPVGTFNMYGGTITGGNASEGGNVMIWHEAAFHMYGGTISGGASDLGSNVCLRGRNANAKMNLLGGIITGGTGAKGSVYVSTGTAVMGGNIQISGHENSEIYIASGQTIALKDLTSTQVMKVEVEAPGVAFTNATTDLSNRFEPTNEDYKVLYNAEDKTLEIRDPSIVPHEHCVCHGFNTNHTCQDVSWQPWDGTTALGAGNYYLTQDVHLTDLSGIKVGTKTINLCLNGHKLSGDGRLFWLDVDKGTLNICDHPGNAGLMEGKGIAGESGGLIRHGYPNSHVGLYNLTMRRSDTGTRTAVTEGGIMSCSGYLDMYNVTMDNGFASNNGGNLVIALAAKVNIYNSTIKNGTTTGASGGGNIRISGNNTSNKVSVTIVDTTITGGAATNASGNGDGVILNMQSNNDLYLGGKIVIDQNNGQDLYMVGNGNVHILDGGLSEGSKIGLTMASPGIIGTSDTDVSKYFIPADTSMQASYNTATKTLYMEAKGAAAHEDHCVCGDHGAGVGDHTTCTDLTGWKPLNAAAFTAHGANQQFISGGNYYLTGDFNVSATIDILADQNVTICLNGYKLFGGNIRMFRVNGTLNITDCGTTGEVTTAYRLAPVFYGYAGGTINLYGGTLYSSYTGTTKSNWGGVGALAKDAGNNAAESVGSTFNMYGGKIIGTDVVKTGGSHGAGGAVVMMGTSNTKRCTFNMYGGEIVAGSAETGGSAVGVNNYNTFNMLGGKITGSTAGNGQILVGGPYSVMTLGGDAQVGHIYLGTDAKLSISTEKPLTAQTKIGISMASGSVFAENVTTDLSGKFDAIDPQKTVLYDADADTLYLAVKQAHKDHSVCEGALVQPQDCTCQSVTWTKLTQAMFDNPDGNIVSVQKIEDTTCYVLKAGMNYYLGENITVNYSITPGVGNTVSICLNGNTLKGDTNCRTMYYKGTINLCDCQYSDEVINEGKADEKTVRTYKGTLTGTMNNYAPVVYVRADGVMNFYGGNMQGVKVTAANKGGGLSYVGGTFHMYGGKIFGGEATTAGGNISVVDNGVMRVYGGLITGGKAGTNGGNIHISSNADAMTWGKLYVYGGEIRDGVAGSTGGNIYQGAGTTLIIQDALIYGGTSTSHGGNIRVGNSTFKNAGDFQLINSKVLNGKAGASGEGGNLYIDGNATTGKGTITGSEIGYDSSWPANTHTAFKGGNIRIKGGKLTITDSTIHSGYASDEGGNMNIVLAATVTVNGNTVIRNGRTDKNGGNLAVFGTLNIQGNAQIKDGVAASRGANISAYGNTATDNAVINMTGGKISGGTGGAGGTIRLECNKGSVTMTMTGGQIEDGTVTSGQNGILVGSANNKLIVGGTAKIESVHLLTGKTLTVHADGFQTGAKIKVTMATDGKVATDLNSGIDYTAFIQAKETTKQIIQQGTELILQDV